MYIYIYIDMLSYHRHLIEVMKGLYYTIQIIINSEKDETEQIIVNRDLRLGCSLSPTIFSMYIDDAIR